MLQTLNEGSSWQGEGPKVNVAPHIHFSEEKARIHPRPGPGHDCNCIKSVRKGQTERVRVKVNDESSPPLTGNYKY